MGDVADRLNRAAEVLREHASRATPGPLDPEVGAAFAAWLADYGNTLECFGDGDRHEGNTPALRAANAILGHPADEVHRDRGPEASYGSEGEEEFTASAEDTRALLVLVEDEFPVDTPTAEQIAAWDCVTRSRVAAWAFAVHLAVSDNDVEIPEPPTVLVAAEGRAADGGGDAES